MDNPMTSNVGIIRLEETSREVDKSGTSGSVIPTLREPRPTDTTIVTVMSTDRKKSLSFTIDDIAPAECEKFLKDVVMALSGPVAPSLIKQRGVERARVRVGKGKRQQTLSFTVYNIGNAECVELFKDAIRALSDPVN